MRRQRKVVGVGFGARRQLSMAASGASLLPRSPQVRNKACRATGGVIVD